MTRHLFSFFLSLSLCSLASNFASNEQIQPSEFPIVFKISKLNCGKLPVCLTPRNKMDFSEFLLKIKEHQKTIQALIKRYGACVLRDCPITNAKEFAMTLSTMMEKPLIEYIGGEGSRRKIYPGVYSSTEAPPQFWIPLHNELSCTTTPPSYICFYCKVAPARNTGHTALGLTHKVTRAIQQQAQDIWKACDGKMLSYSSMHPKERNLYTYVNSSHKTWTESFQTQDVKKVEDICRMKKFQWKWHQGDWLEIIRQAPATKVVDGQKLWLNQIHLFHANSVIRGGYVNHLLANILYMKTFQYKVAFADGTPITPELVVPLYKILKENENTFSWEKGDVLVVDNIKAMHGKTPHHGPRQIYTSMIQ